MATDVDTTKANTGNASGLCVEDWMRRLVDVRRHFDTDEQMASAFDATHDSLPDVLALCGGSVTPGAFAAAMKAIAERRGAP